MTHWLLFKYEIICSIWLTTIYIVPGRMMSIEKSANRSYFPLTIIHINDFHARFEEVNNASEHCRPGIDKQCFGGYGRLVTTVKRLQREQKALNPIYLNAGDNFQGTFWYNVGRWNVTAEFLNMLPADAITIGNHEFSHEIKGLVPFLKALKSPVVIANIDDSDEPIMKNTFKRTLIIYRFNRKIGIIGLILSTVDRIATTGRLRFLDEISTVRKEASALRSQGVHIIVVLSHCGIDRDKEIAQSVGSDVDIIVGGHSHTLMYTGDRPPGPHPVRDFYPIVVRQPDGHQTLIVQASAFAQYVGDLVVWFDDSGELVRWQGNPVFMNESIAKDPEVEEKLNKWRTIIDLAGRKVIGFNRVPMLRRPCFAGECNLGNLLADAAAEYYLNAFEPLKGDWTKAAVVLFNVGSIRANLNVGNVTNGDLMTIFPYENTMDYGELSGSALMSVLEHSVSRSRFVDAFNSPYMIQYSGLNVVFNVSRAVGNRVLKVNILCNSCPVPKYEPIQMNRTYPVVTTSYLTAGGDGFEEFPLSLKNITTGPKDIDVIIWYVNRASPIKSILDGRIQMV